MNLTSENYVSIKKALYFILFIISIIAYVYAYFPVINGKYFSDDFWFQFLPYHNSVFHVFIDMNSTTYAYRPLEKLFLIIIQTLFGLNTLGIHLSHMILHLTFCLSFYCWLRGKNFSKTTSFLIFNYLLLNQAATHAIASIDTISQMIATIFGYFSVALYLSSFKIPSKNRRTAYYICSFLCFTISLLGKETALSFFPIILLIFLYNFFSKQIKIKLFSFNTLLHLIPFSLVVCFYFFIRNYLNLDPATFGDGRFDIHLGLNVPLNLIMSVFQTLLPFSSSEFYLSIKNNYYLFFSISTMMVFMFFFVIAFPLVDSTQRNRQLAILLLLPLSLFPVIILNHVSELYVYNMLPLIALALAVGSELIFKQEKKVFHLFFVIIVLSTLLIDINSVRSKSKDINKNGETAELLLNKIEPFLTGIPKNGTLVLVNPSYSPKTEYSIYKKTGFRVFEDGEIIFNRISNRYDFDIKLVQKNLIGCDSLSGVVSLSIDRNTNVFLTPCP